ncbi:metallophosphoesterase [Corynebacterium pacaense]|uniref:metallophosphoesterase n=1 Tax=Corynebacterium pacaense TaxID=1816684 RepID=UPI0009BA49DE|nr:metallophosphoesterase [Corynebacterium pacaense]
MKKGHTLNLRTNGLRLAIAATTACAVTTGHAAVAREIDLSALNQAPGQVTTPAQGTAVPDGPSDLIITEILPDNTGDDEFEYFEVHNTSTHPVTLGTGAYTFAYSYDDSADTSRDKPLQLERDTVLEAGETLVVWMNYATDKYDTSTCTEEEFRAAHAMSGATRIVRATGQAGLANGGDRGIRIMANDQVASWSHYPSGSASANAGIEFSMPAAGKRSATVLRTLATPTPGEVSEDQLIAPAPEQSETTIFDGLTSPDTAAPLILTELLADSANVGGSDAYEFVEITNTTQKTIDFSDYTLNYLYPTDENTNSNSAVWAAKPGDVRIGPGASLVLWIKNGPNDQLTATDFNSAYGTDLVAGENLVEIHSGGFANGSARGIQIQTNTGQVINRGYYNMAGARDVEADKGLNYIVDTADTTKQILRGSAQPTPGRTHPVQLPDPLQQVTPDLVPPEVTDDTGELITPGQPFAFSFTARDNVGVRTASLRVRSNVDETATEINLSATDSDTYSWVLPAADITGKQWFEYSLTVSDGTSRTTTDTRRIQVEGAETQPLRLNLAQDQWVNGTTDVIGVADSMTNVSVLIDDRTVDTRRSLPAAPTFAMEVTQTDVFFRNGILADGEELLIFDEGTYERIETVSTAVPLYRINADGTLTVSVYAGTKAAPAIDPDENNDDFQIRNLRLILPDGRTLTPAGVGNQQDWLKMGDSAGTLDFFDATFQLPDDAFTGVAHAWDTTVAEDGRHTVTVRRENGQSISRSVQVDNTGPELTITGVGEGQELRGTVEIDATADDSGSGLDSVEALLDGERVDFPLTTGSLDLEKGEHTLVVRAQDAVGNRTERTITFTTPDENPISGDFAPTGGAVVPTGDVKLTARANDPSGDQLDLTFLEADSPTLDSGRVRTSTGSVSDAATTERAQPATLSREEVEKLGTTDGLGTEVSSDSAFPYQLFDIDTPADMAADTRLRINWAGSADSRAQVILYALSADRSTWVEVDRHLTGREQENFTLDGMVNAAEFAVDGTVTVLVQHSEGFAGADHTTRDSAVVPAHPGDVPRSDYDFTLAWESDTQYYNEQYFEHQVHIHDYLLEQRENKNIQFLFHTGDVVDDFDQANQWENASPQYARLDEAGLPYSVLAGNHDVGHRDNDYTEFSRYFGEQRYAGNPWYGDSYKDNRGHYDLFSAGGIDFINVAMGWGPGDEEIAWMNQVLAAHPERVAILNLHEFMLTTGGLGPIPQRILDEVVATNPNVRMVFSGHYHDAFQRTDSFDDDGDGTKERTVTSMLFDYQGLPEGGQGYLRMLHFDNEGRKMMVRTYSPSLQDYNSDEPSLLGPAEDPYKYQEFDLSYDQLGIAPEGRVLTSDSFSADFLSTTEIGSVHDVASGDTASVVWRDVKQGRHSWFVRTEDPFGGTEISAVQSFIAGKDDSGTDTGGSSGSSHSGFFGKLAAVVAGAIGLAGAAFAFVPGLWDQIQGLFRR